MKSNNIPAHIMIRESIINDIMRGVYEKGSMLPQQSYYAEKYGVSRATVRKAMDQLIHQNVIVTVKGKGTFVCDYKQARHGFSRKLSFSEDLPSYRKLHSRVLALSEEKATVGVARQLQIQENDPVVRIARLRIVNDIPHSVQITYLNKRLVSNIDFAQEDLENGSLFQVLHQKAGLLSAYQEEEIRAVICPENIAHQLQLSANAPVLLIFRTVYTDHDVPMEYCEDYESTETKGLKVTTYSNSFQERVSYGSENSEETPARHQ